MTYHAITPRWTQRRLTGVRFVPFQDYDTLVASFETDLVSYWKFEGNGTDEQGTQNATITGQPETSVETIVDLDRVAEGADTDGSCIAWPGTVGEYAQATHNAAHKTGAGTIVVTFQCDTLAEKSILVCGDASGAAGGFSIEVNTNGSSRVYLRDSTATPRVLTGSAGDVELNRAYTLIMKWGSAGLEMSLWDDAGGLVRNLTNAAVIDGLSGTSPIRFGAWHTDVSHHDGPYGRVIWLNRQILFEEEPILARAHTIEHVDVVQPPPTEWESLTLPGPLITTFKNLGTTTSFVTPNVGGNAVYDCRGTVFSNTYNASNDTYSPSLNIRFSTNHNGGAMFGATVINGYAHETNEPRNYPENDGGQIYIARIGGTVALVNWLFEGLRLHHNWDAIRFGQGSRDTTFNISIKKCWWSDNFDDAIENDLHVGPILVEDCLFEDIYGLISDRNATTESWNARIVTFRDCLVRLGDMHSVDGVFQFFKFIQYSVSIDSFDCIYYVPRASDLTSGGDPFFDLRTKDGQSGALGGRLRNSSGNVIVWAGGGSYPFPVLPGFTVTTNLSTWTNAAAAWKAANSHVPRVGYVGEE